MIFRPFSDIFAREYRSKKQAGGGYGQGRGVVVCVALQVLLDYITLPCIAARFRHWRIQVPTHLYDLEMIASFRTDSRCAMPQLGEDEEAEDAPAKTACAVYLRSLYEGVRGAISSGEFRTSDAWQEEIEAMRTFATACQDFVAKMTAEAERARLGLVRFVTFSSHFGGILVRSSRPTRRSCWRSRLLTGRRSLRSGSAPGVATVWMSLSVIGTPPTSAYA